MWEQIVNMFRAKRCQHCHERFTAAALTELRVTDSGSMVKVHCTRCDKPNGISIVSCEVPCEVR